jgi:hypothetical protein
LRSTEPEELSWTDSSSSCPWPCSDLKTWLPEPSEHLPLEREVIHFPTDHQDIVTTIQNTHKNHVAIVQPVFKIITVDHHQANWRFYELVTSAAMPIALWHAIPTNRIRFTGPSLIRLSKQLTIQVLQAELPRWCNNFCVP